MKLNDVIQHRTSKTTSLPVYIVQCTMRSKISWFHSTSVWKIVALFDTLSGWGCVPSFKPLSLPICSPNSKMAFRSKFCFAMSIVAFLSQCILTKCSAPLAQSLQFLNEEDEVIERSSYMESDVSNDETLFVPVTKAIEEAALDIEEKIQKASSEHLQNSTHKRYGVCAVWFLLLTIVSETTQPYLSKTRISIPINISSNSPLCI